MRERDAVLKKIRIYGANTKYMSFFFHTKLELQRELQVVEEFCRELKKILKGIPKGLYRSKFEDAYEELEDIIKSIEFHKKPLKEEKDIVITFIPMEQLWDQMDLQTYKKYMVY